MASMTLTEKEKEEIRVAAKSGANISDVRSWILLGLLIAGGVGQYFVNDYRLGATEKLIEDVEADLDTKADGKDLKTIANENELKLEVIRQDVSHVKEDVKKVEDKVEDVQRTQQQILEEIRSLNR